MKKVAIAAAVALCIATLGFSVLCAVYYNKYINEVPSDPKVCKTNNCAMAAAMMTKKMNLYADPCQDFNEYACGRFIKEAVIPEDGVQMDNIVLVTEANQLKMKEIITEDIKPTEPHYLSNMKRLYRSCTNEAQIEALGLTPYFKDRTFANDWPTLNPAWTSHSFNLNDAIARYAGAHIVPIFRYVVMADYKDSKKNVIFLGDSELGLPMEYLAKPRNDSVIMAYQKYLAETAVALNASRAVAEQDAKDVVDLEIALSKIKVPKEEQRDYSKIYNPVRLGDLSSMYPQLDIPRAIRATFDTASVTLPDDETIINATPTYMGNLSLVINKFTSRTIQNLFSFKYALSKVGSLTRRIREIYQELIKVYVGSMKESPRWKTCLDSSSEAFSKGMGKQFVARAFTQSGKRYVFKVYPEGHFTSTRILYQTPQKLEMNEMIDQLKDAFKKMVEENTWMGEATKNEVYKKLAAMKWQIGYPDANFEEADIEKFYENHHMTEDNYYSNREVHKSLDVMRDLASLRKPVDRNEWSDPPYEANAYYSPAANEMVFLAGFLQSPFFSLTFLDSINYGSVGAVVGHEITHGFDDRGSQYDADGNLRNWWEATDRANFLQKIQCIVDQNSNFCVDEINMTLNGINTQGESVADSGGIKESFRAYKELVRKKGEAPTLPGLHLTQDQIFFLAFGQLWCEKKTPQRYIHQVKVAKHPPGRFRSIGSLQNSPEFAKAYNCPAGSYMNPVKKCTVW